MQRYLGDISLSLDLQLFILIEFLNQNGFNIVSNGLDIYLEQDQYDLIQNSKVELKMKEIIAIKINALFINWLESELLLMSEVKADEDHSRRLAVLKSELKKAQHTLLFREMMCQEAKSDKLIRASRQEYKSSLYGYSNSKEYDVFNSTGYVTSAIGIGEARSLAEQFNGYVVDESGRKI